jgi:hypothetical protein
LVHFRPCHNDLAFGALQGRGRSGRACGLAQERDSETEERKGDEVVGDVGDVPAPRRHDEAVEESDDPDSIRGDADNSGRLPLAEDRGGPSSEYSAEDGLGDTSVYGVEWFTAPVDAATEVERGSDGETHGDRSHEHADAALLLRH